MSKREGFTIVEVIVAIVVFGIGVLALASTSAVVIRMVNRGENTELASSFAAERMELLRRTGCTSQVAGADTLYDGAAGGSWVARNNWSFTAGANNTWRVSVVSNYKTGRGQIRTETSGTTLSCNF